MSDKSYVSMEKHICLVCARSFETNTIIMNSRLRPTLERFTVTGWGLCPEHKKLFDDGYLAIVAVDESQSDKEPDGSIRPNGAYRLGPIAHLKRHIAREIFTIPITDDLPMIFCEPEVIEMLQQLQQK